VSLSGTTADHNAALGGAGGQGGNGRPARFGGPNGTPGLGEGGGVYVDPTASVSLDAFTVAHLKNNTASTSDPDVFGSFTTSP
jgi:hypothetical protein